MPDDQQCYQKQAVADQAPKLDELQAAINAMQPGKLQQKAQLFKQLYPTIEAALSRGVPQKELTELLKQMGLALSVGGFRSLLDAERKRRTEEGDLVCCPHCRSTLPTNAASAESA